VGNDLLRARLAGVGGVEHGIQLLKRATLGLNKEEVDKDELKDVPEDKERVAAEISRCAPWPSTMYGELLCWGKMTATYNQYVMFCIARGAAKVFTNPAQPEVMEETITPLALMSSRYVSLLASDHRDFAKRKKK
jgi:hypothetical protein